jgi:hypothetical protein
MFHIAKYPSNPSIISITVRLYIHQYNHHEKHQVQKSTREPTAGVPLPQNLLPRACYGPHSSLASINGYRGQDPRDGVIENRHGREGNLRNSDIGIHSHIDSSCSKHVK